MTKNVPSSKGAWQILDDLQNIKDGRLHPFTRQHLSTGIWEKAHSSFWLSRSFLKYIQDFLNVQSDILYVCRVWQVALCRPQTRPLGHRRGSPGVHWGAHSQEQPSSRQRPQQINLPVTLHLDCINVELGPIKAIGRTWQSLTTVILASQERPLLNRADKAFFSPDSPKSAF